MTIEMSFSQLIESHQRFHSKHLVRSLHVWKKKVANFVWLIYNIYIYNIYIYISYITSHNKTWFFQLQFCEFVTSAGRFPTGFKKPPRREVSARMAAMTEEWRITCNDAMHPKREKRNSTGFLRFYLRKYPLQKHTINNYNIWGYYTWTNST